MPTRALYRGTSSYLSPAENSAPIFVDSADNQLKVQPNGAGDPTEYVVPTLESTLTTVTQAGPPTSGVTINASLGQITTVALVNPTGDEVSFTVTNSQVLANSVIVANIATYTGAGLPAVVVTNQAVGEFQLTITNLGAATLTTAATINFAVLF